jgi:hypothetical protein
LPNAVSRGLLFDTTARKTTKLAPDQPLCRHNFGIRQRLTSIRSIGFDPQPAGPAFKFSEPGSQVSGNHQRICLSDGLALTLINIRIVASVGESRPWGTWVQWTSICHATI